ncbi:MAG: VOC family protein [Candidatus Latescibacteria bacterium]|nr:VOC family protein [Candidatus Latescibacterota bacterium]
MDEYAFFGPAARFHHIGLAMQSIRAVNPSCEVVVNKTQGVSMAFIRVNGVTVELLEPFGDDSPIARSVRDGVKLLHLCYEVPDLDAALRSCQPAGFHRVSRPVRVPEFENRRIVWVFSKHYGLIELVERDGDGVGGGE